MSVTGQAHAVSQTGLTRLARAIRRSVSLWAAVMTSPEGTPREDVVASADFYNSWVSANPQDDEEAPRIGTFDPTRP